MNPMATRIRPRFINAIKQQIPLVFGQNWEVKILSISRIMKVNWIYKYYTAKNVISKDVVRLTGFGADMVSTTTPALVVLLGTDFWLAFWLDIVLKWVKYIR